MDFTLTAYCILLDVLKTSGYTFLTYEDYLGLPTTTREKVVVLRHDVDLLPENSLRTARMEFQLGIKGTYYFRAVPQSWNEEIIKEIHCLGHEVGYHYECLTVTNGDIPKAYEDFCMNLKRLRKLVPVTTICMHGSPRSPYDSKDIWKHYSYKDLDIIGEPYLDTDFSQFFYLTDTGRRWDGYKVSVRDKIAGQQELWESQGLSFHSTNDVVRAIEENRLPHGIMITVHPQRWNEPGIIWMKEFISQNIKNVFKRIIVKFCK